MQYVYSIWNAYMINLLVQVCKRYNTSFDSSWLIKDTPPTMDKGDIAYPMFMIAKHMGANPAQIAQEVAEQSKSIPIDGAQLRAFGPYVNVFVNRSDATQQIVHAIKTSGNAYGSNTLLQSKRIMIEFSAPNTNKPLHVGHLRNDVLGECMSRLFAFSGADVQKVNLINDRGIHICKSMLAYKKFADNLTPELANIKPDHFVGTYYVEFAKWASEYPHAEQEAQTMLQEWERGDIDVRTLWKTMNDWAMEGLLETYKRTHVSFDKIYYESETYTEGKAAILKGEANGVFHKNADGAVVVSLEALGLDEKVLLRGDGTSLYITQDIGTVFARYRDWQFDTMMYVVAHEQNYHFKVLFYVLQQLEFLPAQQEQMVHLGYGMVHLPDGKMKSREGKVVDADTLLKNVTQSVQQEMQKRAKGAALDDTEGISVDIALGAIHYYLLSVHAKKDVTFNPESSIAFQGNTGPYLQYTCARINSLLARFEYPHAAPAWDDIVSDVEWKVVLLLDIFPATVIQATEKYDPSLLANYLYDLASAFSTWYQSVPIATAEQDGIKYARMYVADAVLQTMRNGLHLLNIPFIVKM